jgi:hypothetical protein
MYALNSSYRINKSTNAGSHSHVFPSNRRGGRHLISEVSDSPTTGPQILHHLRDHEYVGVGAHTAQEVTQSGDLEDREYLSAFQLGPRLVKQSAYMK